MEDPCSGLRLASMGTGQMHRSFGVMRSLKLTRKMCLPAGRCMVVLVATGVVVLYLCPFQMVGAQVVAIVTYHVSATAVAGTVATAGSAAVFAGRFVVTTAVEAVAVLVGVVVAAAVEDLQAEDVLTDSGSRSVFAGAAAGSAVAGTAAVRRSISAAVVAGIGHC